MLNQRDENLLCLTAAQKVEKDTNEWIEIGSYHYHGHDVRRLMCTGKNQLF